MSNEPPTPGPPPEDDPFRKRPQEPPEGGGAPPPPPPPPPGGGGPYGGGPYGGGPYGYGGTDPLSGMPPLADIGKRVLARLIDWLVIAVPLALIGIPFGVYSRVNEEPADLGDVWTSSGGGGQWAFQLISVAAYVAYDTLMTTKRNGQTLGKRITGLRVAMLNDGSTPPASAALTRALVLWLPTLICCACLWPLLLLVLILLDKPYRQGLHDKAARTVVVSAA